MSENRCTTAAVDTLGTEVAVPAALRNRREARRGLPRVGAALLVVATASSLALAGATSASAATRPSNCTKAGQTVTCTFTYTGAEQTFVVPQGVTAVHGHAVGGAGGGSNGGHGAVVDGDLTGLIPGQTLFVNVGGKGSDLPHSAAYNGGGWGGYSDGNVTGGGGGGGASDIRVRSIDDGDWSNTSPGRILVAGAGGGGSSLTGGDKAPPHPASGGDAGSDGAPATYDDVTAQGGFAAVSGQIGGNGGHKGWFSANDGQAGRYATGGGGGEAGYGSGWGGGGGGGGFYAGGGGGSTFTWQGQTAGSGAGGTSLVPAGGTQAISQAPTSVTISYEAPLGSLKAINGSGQGASPREDFGAPLQARLTDVDGDGVTGAPVTFTVVSGSATFGGFGGSASSEPMTTGTDGTVQAPTLTAGDDVGPVRVEASTPGLGTVATFDVTVNQALQADLGVTMSGPSSVRANTRFTVDMAVTNLGHDAAGRVTSVITLPRGIQVGDTGGGVFSADTNTVTYFDEELPNRARVVHRIVAIADGTSPSRSLTLTGEVHAGTADPQPANNTAALRIAVARGAM